MKTQNIILAFVIILLLFFDACREVTVTTKVNPDGTFARVITVTGDSSEVQSTDFPFPVDKSWARASVKDTADSTKYVVTYTRSFRDSDELNTAIKRDTGEYSSLDRNISITKKFRFFFSYLTFREVYKTVNPFTILDYRDSLTEQDLRYFSGMIVPTTPADSSRKKEAENKVLAFFVASATAEAESIMQNGVKKLNNPLLNPADVSIYHDSLYNYINRWDIKNGNEFIEQYRKWSGNESYALLYDLKPPLFEDLTKKMSVLDTVFKLQGYTEVVEMPGLMTATNSAMLQGNQVRWDFQPESVIVRDFELYAESRVINYWAFVLAGIVLLALVIILVIKAVR